DEVPRQRRKTREIRKRPTDGDVEQRRRYVVLGSGGNHLDIWQRHFRGRLTHESRLLAAAVEQGHVPRRPRDGERYPGQADAPGERPTKAHAVRFSELDGASLNPRLRCTSRSEIAAGVTPEIRAAWPSVSGRC